MSRGIGWVIREGIEPGKGQYLTVNGNWSEHQREAFFSSSTGYARGDSAYDPPNNRVVRIVPRLETELQASVDLFEKGRQKGLEEAEKVCRRCAESEVGRESEAVNDCADAIAALRSSK